METLLIDHFSPRFATAEASAREWTRFFLDDRYCPPESLRYVALPRGAQCDCDRMRARYRADGFEITITQSIGVFCAQVGRANGPELVEMEDIAMIAKRLFRNGSAIRLTTFAATDRTRGAADDASNSLPWSKTFAWQAVNGGVAFWMLKDDGHPRMAAIGMTAATNQYWYSVPPAD